MEGKATHLAVEKKRKKEVFGKGCELSLLPLVVIRLSLEDFKQIFLQNALVVEGFELGPLW